MSWPKPDHGLSARLGGPLSHAYILTGGAASARAEAALYLAAAALCRAGGGAPCGRCADCRKLLSGVHPDLHWTRRAGDARQIQVEQIRELRGAVYILPNEAEKSVFAVEDAQFMNPNAQNALLKVFEEPPAHALILLLADNAGALLQTLRSRAVTLRLQEPGEEAAAPAQAAALVSLLRGGDRAGAAALCLKQDKLEREALGQLLSALRRETLADIKTGTGMDVRRAGDFLRLLDKLSNYMEYNVGAGHIAGALAAFAAEPNGK